MSERLSQQEEQAMNVIWEMQEVNVKTILLHLPDPKPPYTTLASTVKNLEKKGYIKSTQVGNMYLYSPLIQKISYKKQTLTNIVKQHFGNSYKDLVTFFAEQKKISPTELKEIVNMIERKKK